MPFKDVFRGGTIRGNICWSVKKSDVGTLLMYWEELFGDRLVFWKLKR